MTGWTQEEIDAFLKDLLALNFWDDAANPETTDAARLLLSGLGRRKHLGDLVRFTGLKAPFVRKCMSNLKAAQIWQGEDKVTYCEWDDEKGGDFAFMLDVMVAVGTLVKTYSEAEDPAKGATS